MTQQDPEYERRLYEQNMALAQRMHDQEFEFSQSVGQAAINSGTFAIRTLVIVNGGAAVALLAFVGSLVSGDVEGFLDNLADLTSPIMWFVWGVALASGSVGCAYFTNYSIAASSSKKERVWDHPYVTDTTASKWWYRASAAFQILSVAAGVASLVCFIYGMVDVRDAITALQNQRADYVVFW